MQGTLDQSVSTRGAGVLWGRLGLALSRALVTGPLAAQLEILPVPLLGKSYFLILSHALMASRPQLAVQLWNGVEEVRNSAAYTKLLSETSAGAGH
jgi:polar amino acid transport system substrate-binding protein